MIGHLAGNLQLFAGREMINRYAPFPAVQMSQEAFGHCTNIGECEAVCPKQIKIETIARMNRDYLKASWTARHKQKFRNDEPIKEPKAGGRR